MNEGDIKSFQLIQLIMWYCHSLAIARDRLQGSRVYMYSKRKENNKVSVSLPVHTSS